MELVFEVKGDVEVRCDVSNKAFTMPIDNKLDLIVKFGDERNDDNEDILILPHGEFELSVAQYLFETTVLAIPLKKVDPDLEKSAEGRAMLEALEKLSPSSEEQNKEETETDPRWDKLKGLLN
jgi:uncharacterized metal-binding protein YceD (DUF177 family)